MKRNPCGKKNLAFDLIINDHLVRVFHSGSESLLLVSSNSVIFAATFLHLQQRNQLRKNLSTATIMLQFAVCYGIYLIGINPDDKKFETNHPAKRKLVLSPEKEILMNICSMMLL